MDEPMSVAVLGLGAMGSRVAANLAASGFEVNGWNRTSRPEPEERSLTMAASPAAAARGAAVVLSFVRDDEASEQVWLGVDGALGGLDAQAVAVECSTIRPAWSRRLAEQIGGHRYIEAPMVGSLPQVEARQLVHLTGGDPSVVDTVRSALDVSAAAIHHVGGIGSATTLKLAVNTLLAAQVFLGAELVELLAALDPADAVAAVDVLAQLPVCSPALARALPSLTSTDEPPKRFPLELVAKDLAYTLDAMTTASRETPLVSTLTELATRAVAQDHGERDITAIRATRSH